MARIAGFGWCMHVSTSLREIVYIGDFGLDVVKTDGRGSSFSMDELTINLLVIVWQQEDKGWSKRKR